MAAEKPSATQPPPPPPETETTTTTSEPATTQTNTQATVTTSSPSSIVGTTCMELALEGERRCTTGDLKNGVQYFEEAIKVGTSDQRTLSAIYSQLGNAYFHLEDFQKALEFHKMDVTLVHSIGDEEAEAKACGNLGNTFKMLGKFDEAAVYCRRHLELSRKRNDQKGEGRALYNLGNVYHTQGKRMISASEQEPGELSNDIRSSLQRAIEYYEMNLKVVTELKDNVAMGRAYGNLGNTHYLLGNFDQAVDSHQRRLQLAKDTNDKSAERRAYLNLGNANVFLGNFPEAIENYSATLKLAQELQDKYTEAHSCYSLANTYTFLRDYKSAIDYHLRYLELITSLDDKLGEGRACWSLVNIYQMVNDPESALVFAKKHHEIAAALGDKAGLASAKLNIEELEETVTQKQAAQAVCGGGNDPINNNSSDLQHQTNQRKLQPDSPRVFRLSPDKRQEQEQRRFKRQLNSNLTTDIDGLTTRRRVRDRGGPVKSSSSERLFDMIAHFQSGRIDDQRCEILRSPLLNTSNKTRIVDDKENSSNNISSSGNNINSMGFNENRNRTSRGSQPSINPMNAVAAAASAIKATYRKASLVAYPTPNAAQSIQSQRRPTVSAEHRDQLFDLIAGAQGQRMDEQRASLPALSLANGVLRNPTSANLLSRGHTVDQSTTTSTSSTTSASNKNQIIGKRPETILESRGREKSHSIVAAPNSPPGGGTQTTSSNLTSRPRLQKLSKHFQTVDSDHQVHDDRFLDSLMKYQSTRFDDQRSEFPKRDRAGSLAKVSDKGQPSDFFNLIVRYQSDRIDDQRSAPPATNKNI